MPELTFKGKEFVYNHHLTVPYRPVVPLPDKSLGDGTLKDNLILHGDNLHSLKALLPMYGGRVNCVFIDPPYNTGNENWSYNDNVNSPLMQEWLNSNPVNKEDMLRHDKWLCMMYPRVRLLYELLADDGSLWLTLDDNEMHRARLLLDEIFGEERFIATIVWQKKDTAGNDSSGFSASQDYVIGYAKTEDFGINLWERTEAQLGNYKNPDKDPRGPWLGSPLTRSEYRERDYYALTNKVGAKVFPPKGTSWRFPPETIKKFEKEDKIWWGKKGDATFPFRKKFLSEVRKGVVPITWWTYQFAGSNRTSNTELRQIFDGDLPFQNPKPSRLLERLFEIVTEPDSIVLDSFAGSGTTGHAILSLNKKDGGSRRFILVESEDYAERLTAERLRRVIGGYSFKGNQREELFREEISFTSFKNAESTLQRIATLEQIEGHRFDRIKKEISHGVLSVTGEKSVTETTEGLSGTFTFCTLGDPLDLDSLLTGKVLPDYSSLGAWLFHTATGEAFTAPANDEPLWFLGETKQQFVWLVYKPDLSFLTSRDAVLTLSLAEHFTRAKTGKRHLVFAPSKFVPNRTLSSMKVDFAQLPFAVYRIDKD